MKHSKFLWWILIVALLCVFYFHTVAGLINSWLSDPYYSHGFLIPIISGSLIWWKRNSLKYGEDGKKGILILIVSMVLYLIGYFFSANYISAVSLITCIIALAFIFYGKSTKNILFPLCFLIFMVPFPFFESLGMELQLISAQLSASLINALGVPADISGTIIALKNYPCWQQFEIDLSCSGMTGLITLLAVATLFTYFLKCETYKKIILIAIAIPTALFTNILRITSAILTANYYGVELATTLYHDIFGIIFLIISVIFLIISIKFLKCKVKI